MQDVHPRRVAGEEFTLLDGGVSAADHRQLLALEEGAVADRAIADAPAPELLLARHLEVARQASGGHDQSRRAKLLARFHADDLGVPLDDDLVDGLEVADVDAELPGVVAHLEGELRPEHGLETRVVLDQLGVQELTAEGTSVQDHGSQVHAGGVERGRQPGGPAPHDDHVVLAHCLNNNCSQPATYS